MCACARHKAAQMPGKSTTREDLGSGPILQPDPGPANWKANTSPFKAAHRGRAAANAQLPTAHVPLLKLYLYVGFMEGCDRSKTSAAPCCFDLRGINLDKSLDCSCMSSVYTCTWRRLVLVVLGALVCLPVWYTAVCHWSAVYACPSKESNSSWLLSLSLYLEAIKVLLSEDWTDKERSVSAWEGKHFTDDHLNKDLKDVCSVTSFFFLSFFHFKDNHWTRVTYVYFLQGFVKQ